MIIDANCQVGKGQDYELSADDLVGDMDANDVAKSVIVPTERFLAVYNREGNDFLLASAREHPGRLFPLATANPWYGDKAIEELKRALGAGAIGLMLHPPLQGFKIADAIVYPLIELAGELKKPVYFHTGTLGSAMPFQLAELAMQFSHVTFIMGHMAFSDVWNDVAKAAQSARNIFLETSMYWPSFIISMSRQVGPERMMFGSSVPKNSMNLEIEKITQFFTSEQDKEQILHRTARAVFEELQDGD